jgi:hypothetical protein
MGLPQISVAQDGSRRFDAGMQVTSAMSGQFDASDVGVGGRFAWHPVTPLAIEAEIDVYPNDFPDPRPFSRARVEGLFGVTAAIPFRGVRPFARLRPGFVAVHEAPAPFPCILIFPPPLACSLASGRTLLAVDVGGGVEIPAASRTFLRVDIGDRLVRYQGPVFDANRVVRDGSFISHDFRLGAGVGVRF